MSTRPIAARPKAAKDIKVGDRFATMTAEGERKVIVEDINRDNPKAWLFACRDVDTCKMLPAMKRAEDLGQ
jgi:hypothetical protein